MTPPGKPAHAFEYTDVNLTDTYTAPRAEPMSTAPVTDRLPALIRRDAPGRSGQAPGGGVGESHMRRPCDKA